MSPPTNPFRGLAYFGPGDHRLFGGRDREVRSVVSGILASRTFLLYGASGLGKTSLILAAVLPALQRAGCRTVYVRTLVDPLGDLRSALRREIGGKPDDDLASLVDLADDDGPVVVVFDQFEEFFRNFGRRGQDGGSAFRAFVRAVGRLSARSDLNLRLVFSLREDWLAKMQAFSRAIPGIEEHGFRLRPLTAFGVRQSILQTFKAAGTHFDPRLVSALVEALAEVQFDPAVLQVVASEVWEHAAHRSGDEPLRAAREDFVAIGGVAGILRGHLDQALRCIPESESTRRLQLRAVLDVLITPERTKRARAIDKLGEQYFEVEPEALNEILQILESNRLIRRDLRGDIGKETEWVELLHERLVEPILAWLAEDFDFLGLRTAYNLVHSSSANRGWRDDPGLLLGREHIDETVWPYRDLLRLSAEERLFLVSSATYNHSRHLEQWVELAGRDVTTALLERLFDIEDNPRVRRQAAKAARRMEDPEGVLADRSFELALSDPDEEVRRAAANSFVLLAESRHFDRLAEALMDRKRRRAALPVLVEALAEEALPKEAKIRWRDRRRARALLYERRRDEAEPILGLRTRRGMVAGLVGGPLWLISATLPMLGLFDILLGGTRFRDVFVALASEPLDTLYWTFLGLVASAGVGLLFGRWTATHAGVAALRANREGQLFRAITGWRTCLSAMILWLIASVASIALLGLLAVLVAAFFLLAPLLLFWPGILAAIGRPWIWPGRSRVPILWAWIFVGTCLPLALAESASFALILGFVGFVGVFAVSYSSPGWKPGSESLQLAPMPEPPSRLGSRLRMGLAAAALIALGGSGVYVSRFYDSVKQGPGVSSQSGPLQSNSVQRRVEESLQPVVEELEETLREEDLAKSKIERLKKELAELENNPRDLQWEIASQELLAEKKLALLRAEQRLDQDGLSETERNELRQEKRDAAFAYQEERCLLEEQFYDGELRVDKLLSEPRLALAFERRQDQERQILQGKIATEELELE